MSGSSDIAVLTPWVIRQSPLPRRWMKRGRFVDLTGMDGAGLLARAFDIEDSVLAPAPLHYLGMSGREPAGYCLFAYPVHLHPRREQLILMAGPDFELRESEAEQLIAELRAHFQDWCIERTSDGMWFLLLDEDPELETTSLDEVLGENINDHLPRGGDAMNWHSIMNELQMVLFGSAVNQRREEAGEPTLNSLWFWGGGRLPAAASARWNRLISNDPVALGLGRLALMEIRQVESQAVEDVDISVPGTFWVHTEPGSQDKPAVPSDRQWNTLGGALRRSEIGALILMEPGYGELHIEAGRGGFRWPWR